jgi:hypothetical protein
MLALPVIVDHRYFSCFFFHPAAGENKTPHWNIGMLFRGLAAGAGEGTNIPC